MHYWGDEWKYWDMLYKAIDEVSDALRKAHIGFYSKEKYGTMRLDFLRYWDGTLHGWFRPSYCAYRDFWGIEFLGTKMFIVDKQICRIIFRPWFVRLVHDWQHKHHLAIITKCCKLYPEIKKELLFDCGLLESEEKELRHGR